MGRGKTAHLAKALKLQKHLSAGYVSKHTQKDHNHLSLVEGKHQET